MRVVRIITISEFDDGRVDVIDTNLKIHYSDPDSSIRKEKLSPMQAA